MITHLYRLFVAWLKRPRPIDVGYIGYWALLDIDRRERGVERLRRSEAGR